MTTKIKGERRIVVERRVKSISLALFLAVPLIALFIAHWEPVYAAPSDQSWAATKVNRTIPTGARPASRLSFSQSPTDSEFLRAGIFPEPLAPVAKTTSQENRQLAAALVEYRDGISSTGDADAVEPILTFLARHPDSSWAPALWLDLGIVYRNTGHFSKALRVWQAEWNETQHLTTPQGRAVANAIVSRLSQLEAYLGRKELLQPLLTSLEGRSIGGTAAQLVVNSKTGLYDMQHQPETSFRCGPLALKRILYRESDAPDSASLQVLDRAHSTSNGLSLRAVGLIANRAGMNYQMAFRSPGSVMIIPAVAHWKVGHYAAVVDQAGGKFVVQDTTFGEDIRVSPPTLDEEASGYFLVPSGALPDGWRKVSTEEGDAVWGRGDTGQDHDTGATGANPKKKKPCKAKGGCTTWDVEDEVVGLQLQDRPVGYFPARGPAVQFDLVYSHRDTQQPATFSYTNLGAKWTFNWLSYITDSVGSNASALLYRRGGGNEPFTFTGTTGTTAYPGPYSQGILTRTVNGSGATTGFTLTYPDGSFEKFTQALGSQFFMTAVADKAGNQVTLTYDSQMRITAITDAIGQVSTLTYSLAGSPLVLTKITDPFGRSASFTYNSSGLLSSITDVLGITSSYTYGQGSDPDFVNTLTTPYGSTTFVYGDSSTNSSLGSTRFLKTTDPLGRTSYIEYDQGIDAGDTTGGVMNDASQIPVGMNTCNQFLQYRNTFIFDPNQFALAQGTTLNHSLAKVIHWMHSSDETNTSRVPESVKEPLENRVWFNYPGQPTGANCDSILFGVSSGGVVTNGASDSPVAVGRVVEDGSTQLQTFLYNSEGNITFYQDPMGRQMSYTYAGNGIDLLTSANTTSGTQVLETRTYNAQHFPLTITGTNGLTRHLQYNAAGQLTRYLDPQGHATSLSYDGAGHLKTVQGAISGDTYTFAYDSAGRIAAQTDPAEATLHFTYDAADRLLTTSYPDGTTKRNAFTLLDLTSITDRLGQTTRFTVDSDREATKLTDALNHSVTYGYSLAGKIATITDGNGHTTTRTFDAESRETSKQYANGRTDYTQYESTISLPATKTDALGQITTYTFNPDNTNATISYTSAQPTPSVSYTYDPVFRRIASVTDGIGTTSYTYYPVASNPFLGANQLQSVNSPIAGGSGSDTVTYTYDALNRIVGMSVNGNLQSVVYDSIGRVTGETNPLDSFSYTYADATARVSGVSSTQGPTISYTYYGVTKDELLAQITATTHTGGALDQFEYTYNADNNVGSFSRSFPALLSYTYGYDKANRLTSASSTTAYAYTYDSASNLLSLSAGGTTQNYAYTSTNAIASATYDAEGNPLLLAGSTYTWDGAGRIVAFAGTGGKTSTFTYNGLGQLVRIVDKMGGTVTADHAYFWCGVVRCLAHDNTQSGSPISATYFGQGVIASGTAYYYVRDGLASVRELITTSGSAAVVYDYDPYGNSTIISGSVSSDIGYAGYFQHPFSGLDFTMYRALDPAHGRWLNRDPIREDGGANLYAYANDNPVSQVDPLGLLPGECYPTLDSAGANAINDINGQSIAQNVEYGGRIYQNPDGSYSYTSPHTDNDIASVDTGPVNSNTVGEYHTHGADTPGYRSEFYSPADIGNAIEDGLYIPGYASYLGTPSGTMWSFIPHSYVGDPSQPSSPADMQQPQSQTVNYNPDENEPCECGNK